MIKNFNELFEELKAKGICKKMIAAWGVDSHTIEAASLASDQGFVKVTLVGDKDLIAKVCSECNIDIAKFEIVDIKDELKELGCKFIKALSCWSSDHELESIKTIKVNAADLYEMDNAGVYLWQWMKVAEGMEIIRQANDDLKASESKSSYVGQIGDKIEVKARLTKCHSYDSTFNHHTVTTFINIFTDEAGNVYVWKSTAFFDAGLDDVVIIKGTVKDHSEYNGIKQTILTRCKVTKEVME